MRFRLGFSLAVAVIAAAIADAVAECVSNAGIFGPGTFTDHSNLDVIPALIAGVALLVLLTVRKARAILAGRVLPGGAAPLVLPIFALQIATLYVMETCEQLFVWHHTLGPSVWLGAPLPGSLAIHAAVGAIVAYAIVRSKRTLAATTLRVIRLVRAIATLPLAPTGLAATLRGVLVCYKALVPVQCTIGERAPPLASH